MNIAVIIGEIAYISRSKIMNGITDAAAKDGVNIILFTCEGFIFHYLSQFSAGEYNIFNLPEMENYDGIIADLDSIENKQMQECIAKRIAGSCVPCVSFNRPLGSANQICFENEHGFRALVEHLICAHELTNIHYISGPFGNRDALQRLDVFRNTLAAHGLNVSDDDIFEGDFNFTGGRQAAMEYISGNKHLPQAFVCANDFMAIGLLEELTANGIKVPEDVIITGYDNTDIAALTAPRLTTVDRCEYEAGVLAYQKLMNRINGTENGSCEVISGKPIFSESCGCSPVAARKKSKSMSAVDIKVSMDEGLDLLKGLTLGLSNMEKASDFEIYLESFIRKIGMESFYFCQCGSRESYYEELELMAEGRQLNRSENVYQDTVWCPFAYENGKWSSYPSYSRKLLFPPGASLKKEGGYYIVMPVHQGETCIGYSIIGNFDNRISGRILQHLVIGIDSALGNIRRNDIMSTMLARINRKWQYDELTQLFNRSGLINNAEALIERARASDKGVSVIFFDLDGLKAINDSQGHDAGDKYICAMADILKESTDHDDIVCRYGGDEYIVVSVQESEESSLAKLDGIMQNVKEPVSASAGCVFGYARSIETLNRLIEEADRNMYAIKKERKRSR